MKSIEAFLNESQAINEGALSYDKIVDDIFDIWDDTMDDGREGIQSGHLKRGNQEGRVFDFHPQNTKFAKQAEAYLRKNKIKYEFDNGQVFVIMKRDQKFNESEIVNEGAEKVIPGTDIQSLFEIANTYQAILADITKAANKAEISTKVEGISTTNHSKLVISLKTKIDPKGNEKHRQFLDFLHDYRSVDIVGKQIRISVSFDGDNVNIFKQ